MKRPGPPGESLPPSLTQAAADVDQTPQAFEPLLSRPRASCPSRLPPTSTCCPSTAAPYPSMLPHVKEHPIATVFAPHSRALCFAPSRSRADWRWRATTPSTYRSAAEPCHSQTHSATARGRPDVSRLVSCSSAGSASPWAAAYGHCPVSLSPSRGPHQRTAPPRPVSCLQRPMVHPPLPLQAHHCWATPAIPRPNRRLSEDRTSTSFLPSRSTPSLRLSYGLPLVSPFGRRTQPWRSHSGESLLAPTPKMGSPPHRPPPRLMPIPPPHPEPPAARIRPPPPPRAMDPCSPVLPTGPPACVAGLR
jgi:hypothetical protein